MGLFAECEYEGGCRAAPEEAERLPPEHFASPMTFQMAPTAWPVTSNAQFSSRTRTSQPRGRLENCASAKKAGKRPPPRPVDTDRGGAE